MPTNQEPAQRTDWAEQFAEQFLAQPLIAEWVFRSPQTVDATQKEVADFLLLLREQGILVSQKCQQDPASRSGTKLALWAAKKAREAAEQISGALRLPKRQPIWCEHPRRGRVEFPSGLPQIVHALAARG